MNHKDEYLKRAGEEEHNVELFLFGWVDDAGNGGDYGLNVGPASKTFTTLISTTYMFQPEPKFTLQCRAFQMSARQFEFLQDHDLDTQDFLATLGPLPDVAFELDLRDHPDAASALLKMEQVLGD